MHTSVLSSFQNPTLHSLKSEGTTIPIQSSGKISSNSCNSFQHNQDFVFYVYHLKTTASHPWAGSPHLKSALKLAITGIAEGGGNLLWGGGQWERGFLINQSHELILCSICQNQTSNFDTIAFQFTYKLLIADAKLPRSKLYGKGVYSPRDKNLCPREQMPRVCGQARGKNKKEKSYRMKRKWEGLIQKIPQQTLGVKWGK